VEELGLEEDVAELGLLPLLVGVLGFVEGVCFPGCWFWEEFDTGDLLAFVPFGDSLASLCCESVCLADAIDAEELWRF
jgi:hypothetical protein